MRKSDNKEFLQQRMQLIIMSAKICFSRSGFHGASIADISRESGLGAGQIYRYFTSKELIVSETIKSIAVDWRFFLKANLPQQTSTKDIIDTGSSFWQDWSFQERCLLIEIYSEASRNTSVKKILEQEDLLLVTELDILFQNQMPESSQLQRSNRIQFLLMLIDGVACRTFNVDNVERQELNVINGILRRHLFC